MKISTAGNSKLLRQEDVAAPFVAIIQDVRVEKLKDRRGVEEDAYIVHFATGKPMKFNVVNRKTVVAAYGDDREAWIGKPVEIYVDPNVWMGAERTGGIRVRIPVPAPIAAARPAAPKPAPPTPPPLTLDDKHAQALAGIAQADTIANLDAWAKWAKGIPFDERQEDDLADAYHHRKEQLSAAPAGRRATTRRA
jgi:hypothetical protein